MDYSFQPLLDEAFPHPSHCGGTHVEGSADLLIGPAWACQASISLQENAAMCLPFGACTARRDQLLQARSLFWIEGDQIAFSHPKYLQE